MAPFGADAYYTGGVDVEFSPPLDHQLSGLTNPAPSAVYDSIRQGASAFSSKTTIFCRASLVDGVTLGGAQLRPDETKAYLDCSLSHSWPVITWYGEALSPWTIKNSAASMLHQPVNRDHRMHAYDREANPEDWIIGCVVGVQYSFNERLPASVEASPGIQATASLFKLAKNVDIILGQHQASRRPYTVSMEVRYLNAESGFLVGSAECRVQSGESINHQPSTLNHAWAQHGWLYVPATEADDALLKTRDWKKNRMVDRREDGRGYCGHVKTPDGWRECYWLMGGPDGTVHYSGIGVVRAGAEPTAQITQMVARNEEIEALDGLLDEFRRHLETFEAAL